MHTELHSGLHYKWIYFKFGQVIKEEYFKVFVLLF